MKIKVVDVKKLNSGERYILSCKFTETSKVETFVVSSDTLGSVVKPFCDLIGNTIEFDFDKLKVCTFKENGVDTFGNYIHNFKVISEIKDFVAVVRACAVTENNDGVKEKVLFDCVMENGEFLSCDIDINSARMQLDRYNLPPLKGKKIKFSIVSPKKRGSSGLTYGKIEKFEILDTVDKSENLKNSAIYTEELGNILKLLNLTQVKL